MKVKDREAIRKELETSDSAWKYVILELLRDLEQAEGLVIRLRDEVVLLQTSAKRDRAIIQDLRSRVQELEDLWSRARFVIDLRRKK